MNTELNDLMPQPFKIQIKSHEFECKPLTLSHTLLLAKVGAIFQDTSSATQLQIENAEKDIYKVISDVIPDLKGVTLSQDVILDLIAKMMETVQPSENKELTEKGVKFDSDPKEQKNGQ